MTVIIIYYVQVYCVAVIKYDLWVSRIDLVIVTTQSMQRY